MKKAVIFFVSCCLLSFYQGWSQYNIKFTLDGLQDNMLYLVGSYGSDFMIFDSAKVKQGKSILFAKKSQNLPSGIYQLVNQKGDRYLMFLVEKSRFFSVQTSLSQPYHQAFIENSPENIAFFEYLKMQEYADSLPENYLQDLLKTVYSPILQLYVKAMNTILTIPDFTNEVPEKALRSEYQYLTQHYFDPIDFSDSNILRIPIDYHVDDYFNDIIFQHADSIIKELSHFIDTKLTQVTVKKYFINYLFHLYNDGTPTHNIALVYLFDRFCTNDPTEYLQDYEYQRINRIVKSARKLLPGAKIPALQAYNIHNQLVSSDTISHKYILLWFWDPDCEDCMVETPELHRFYNIYKDIYDFEVYAVSVTEDYERWDKFIQENNLDWINVSYAMGIPNYDFVQYFDIFSTPGIYLINREHIIIARQFALDMLNIYFEQ